MPELPIVGQVAEPPEKLEPIVLPVCAYTHDGEEVIEKFPFKPRMPIGVVAALERLAGNPTSINDVLNLCSACLMEDARARWSAFLDREDLNVEAETLAEGFRVLLEAYGERPTKRSSGSSRTGARSGRTSKGAARAKA